MTHQLQIANQHDHTHQVNEYFDANESHFSSNDDYLAEINMADVVLRYQLVLVLAQLVN